MNFYKAQDEARKQTVWLLVLFTLAVSILVVLTNICVAVFVLYSNPEYALNGFNPIADADGSLLRWCENLVLALGWKKFIWTTLLVVGVLFMAMLFKWLALRDGGKVVAESLGGRPILTNTTNVQEKRLLNIVEEMALAAGIPVPQVFLLEHEQGINAFAAGLSIEDAVIGVTKGSLDAFNRDQLQGVIAHEFSHILNGDMRLNMKLLVVLHGILMISESGLMMMRFSSHSGRRYSGGYRLGGYGTSSRNQNGGLVAGLFAFGLCLWLLGSIGQLFGMIIKSAVSRQREFLADASAVQFTRNPNGIGEALSVIGGSVEQSRVMHHSAHEMSHLFFSRIGAPRRYFTQFFATHPPLEERIRRVLPRWNGRFIKSRVLAEQSADPIGSNQMSHAFVGAGAMPKKMTDSGNTNEALEPIEFESVYKIDETFKSGFDLLMDRAHEPSEAPALMCALLIAGDESLSQKQFEILESKLEAYQQIGGNNLSILIAANQVPLANLDANQRLALVEILIPTLKQLSLVQYKACRQILLALIHADGKVDLFEWLIFQLLKQHCDRHFSLAKPEKPKYKDIKRLAPLYQVVLSRIVYYGENREQAVYLEAFRAGCLSAGIDNIDLLPLNACQSGKFTRAVHELGLAYPLLKPRLLKGLYAAARSDEVVTAQQSFLIKGVAAVMDCPFGDLEATVQ